MIVGVVLAGGASRRMGGRDKAAIELDGETLLKRAVRRLRPQVDRTVVNAPPGAWRDAAVPLVPDDLPDQPGPLAGLLAAMARADEEDRIVTVAVDTPFFPEDLVSRLLTHQGIAFAGSGGRVHPVFGIWPACLCSDLRAFLEGGERKILAFADRHGFSTVEFETDPSDPFFNVNTPDDLAEAQRLAAA